MTGSKPVFNQYPEGTYAYNTDRNNFAPSLGAAWQAPGSDNGIGRLFFGAEEGDSVFRGGAAMAFQRPGMSDFTGIFGGNQGIQVTLNVTRRTRRCRFFSGTIRRCRRAPAVGVSDRADGDRTSASTRSIRIFRCRTPQSYSVGWQRKLTRDSALEVRYVGSRASHGLGLA